MKEQQQEDRATIFLQIIMSIRYGILQQRVSDLAGMYFIPCRSLILRILNN